MIVPIQVAIIWCINGILMNIGKEDQPFGETLKNIAIGIDDITPHIAALLVAFLQNNPIKKTANIPGLTTPVYS